MEGQLQSCSVPLESIPLMDGIDLAVGKPKVPHFLLHDQYCRGVNYNPSCDGAPWPTVYSARTRKLVTSVKLLPTVSLDGGGG